MNACCQKRNRGVLVANLTSFWLEGESQERRKAFFYFVNRSLSLKTKLQVLPRVLSGALTSIILVSSSTEAALGWESIEKAD